MKEWFEYTLNDLMADPEKRQEVFKRMIDILETEGRCRGVFHHLAELLFNDRME